MRSRALIGLGSNVGDRRATLDGAVGALLERAGVNLQSLSSFHETPPVGGPAGQGAFLNAVAVLEPALDPFALLDALHAIEAQFGRDRTIRWGERTLDLDLLLYGGEIWNTRELVLPHPRFAFRRFALAPAAEVAPAAVDPMSGRTVLDLLRNVDRRPSLVCVDRHDSSDAGPTDAIVSSVCDRLRERLGGARVPETASGDGPEPPSATYRDRAEHQFRWITTAAEALSAQRWAHMDHSDQWLVANFSLELRMRQAEKAWLHAALDSHEYRAANSAISRLRSIAAAGLDRAVSPTILILIAEPEPHVSPLAGWSSPVVVMGSDDVDKITDEAFAACQATRS